MLIILILLFTILCPTPEHWGQWHLSSPLDQCSKKKNSQNISVYKVVDCKGHRVWCLKTRLVQTININPLRASPTVLSMWLQTVKFITKKSKCAGLAQEIGFSAPNSCSFPWLVKGATQLCTSKKEYNKLDLITAQYFWLVDHNDWSGWFAISSPHIYAVPVTEFYWWGCQKKKTAELRCLILSSRVTYWAPVEML
jgi:hypothetical protein